MSRDLSALVGASLAPLAGDSPAGANARYEDAYDQAKTEIGKLTAVAAGETGVNWDLVVDNCADLLAKSTKDLNLASYLALGLLVTDGYPGLAAGLRVVQGLTADEVLWPALFPPVKRLQARANAYDWLDQRLSEAIAAREPDPAQADAVRESLAQAQALNAVVPQKVTVPVTGFSNLRAALQKWVDGLPAPAPAEPSPAPAPPPPEQAATPAAPPAVAAPAPPAPAPVAATPALPNRLDDLSQGVDTARGLANLLRGLDPLGPLAYRLARVVKWEPVTEVPEADPGGQTLIPGPRDEDRQSLNAMHQAGNWKDLAEEAESQFLAPAGTFDLDLQRLAATALEKLGAPAAAQAIQREAGLFLNRLPRLAALKFQSGRPLADAATQQWLAAARALASGGGDAAAPEEPWRQKALELAGAGQLPQALETVQQAVATAPGLREVLQRRLLAANLCLDGGKPAWATPILEDLASRLEGVELGQWEPGFVAGVWGGLVRGYQAQNQGRGEADPELAERLQKARARLFATDLALAVRLSQQD